MSFPSHDFDEDNVEIRFRELRMAESVSRRWLGLPRGVYTGYVPQATGGSLILSLLPDERVGFSSLKVGAQAEPVQVDIFTKETVTLNFTGHTQFPVFVIARADFARDTHTRGRIMTRTTGAAGPQEINICKVDKPGSDLVVDASVPDSRQLPVAFSGQEFGYMLPGAAEDIVFAQTVTAEVITARNDIKNPGPPPGGQLLADRLAIDLAADYLSSLLGLRNCALVGNVKIVPGAVSGVNVSGSFAATSREFAPQLDIAAGGSESVVGAITDPDARNVCFIVDETTGHRVIDADRHPVYGRLQFASAALTGTLAFDNAQIGVVGTGTAFLAELEEGDIIIGDDGKWYEVASIGSNVALDLTVAYQGPDVAGAVSNYRRFTLLFYSRGTGTEVGFTLAEPVNMRFFFSAWFPAELSVFDALAFMKKVGERPVLGEATGDTEGRILLAISGAKAGAVFTVNNNQASIGNNFHTLNFGAENASVSPAGTGVANITVQGNTGPSGPGAIVGPPGPVGPPGAGMEAFNAFASDFVFYGPSGAHSMTIDFATEASPISAITHVTGGFSRIGIKIGTWYSIVTGDNWEITEIAKIGSSTARISVNLGAGGAQSGAKLFLSACK